MFLIGVIAHLPQIAFAFLLPAASVTEIDILLSENPKGDLCKSHRLLWRRSMTAMLLKQLHAPPALTERRYRTFAEVSKGIQPSSPEL